PDPRVEVARVLAVVACEGHARDTHATRVEKLERVQAAQQRRLAASRGPDNHLERRFGHRKAHALDGLGRSEGLAQILHPDQVDLAGAHAASSPPRFVARGTLSKSGPEG